MSRLLFLTAIACGLCTIADANPIIKVIGKLDEEKRKVQNFLEVGQKDYDKFHCWFVNSSKDLEAQIQNNQGSIKDSQSQIASNSAASAKAKQELSGCQKDKADASKNSQENDANKSQKQVEYNQFVQDSNALITGLKNAIIVLKKQQGKLFVQTQNNLSKLLAKSSASLEDRQAVEDFFGTPSLLQGPADRDDYQSRSGAIFGMLTNMLENAERDLNNKNDEWDQDQIDMNKMATTYGEQIAAAQECIEDRQATASNADAEVASNEETVANAEAALEAARTQLAENKKVYQDTSNEWDANKKDMNDQRSAITEAIAVLDSDTLLKAGSKDGVVNFLQKKGDVAGLMQAAAGNEAFKSVYDAIDAHIKKIKNRQDLDRESKKSCEELENDYKTNDAANKAAKEQAETRKAGLQAKINALQSENESLEDSVDKLQESWSDYNQDHKESSAERNAAIKEQVDALPIIEKAKQILAAKFAGSFIQQPAAPQAGEASGNVIIAIFDKIMGDMKHTVKVNREAQNQADADHSDEKNASTANIQDNTATINANDNTIADHNKAIGEVDDNLDQLASEREDLNMQNQELGANCNDKFLNGEWFEQRRSNQDNEMSAMRSAKQTLQQSG